MILFIDVNQAKMFFHDGTDYFVNNFILTLFFHRIVLDPLFPPPEMSQNRKLLINELPQEIKYQLIFDEKIEGPELK